MSKVKNEPKYKNGLLQAIRAQLEHRAFWLYLLCDEAAKRGLDPRDFGSAAVKRCGLSQGADLVRKGNTDSLKGLRKVLFNKPAQLVFEMDILKSTDDALDIDFHYCPLVKAWQKAGCSDEKSPCSATSPCAATTVSVSATAAFWICQNASPREMMCAPYGITRRRYKQTHHLMAETTGNHGTGTATSPVCRSNSLASCSFR